MFDWIFQEVIYLRINILRIFYNLFIIEQMFHPSHYLNLIIQHTHYYYEEH
jgi:hypothetical protein